MLGPAPKKSAHKIDSNTALIVVVTGVLVSCAWVVYRYGLAAHRLSKFIPVAGRQIKSGPYPKGYYLEYTYQYQGKIHVGYASTTQATADQLFDFTVLVNPLHPEKSCIQDLFC